MRDFLESLAMIFVWLGGATSAIGLFLLLLAVFSSSSEVSVLLGLYVMLSGVAVTFASGSVYLLALIAESVRRCTPQELRVESLTTPESPIAPVAKQ